jgi:tRNA nucleotidyltransferase/poly(A) polymerase
MKMYEVGGCVRDEILGVPSKDIDFTVVLDNEFYEDGFDRKGNTPFEVMTLNLRKMGFKIFLETPEYLTVRAQFPKGVRQQSYENARNNNAGITADFVLARKESDYTDGRRPDKVEIGTLEDDLARRDFTMNAIAKDTDGNFIDPFDGRADIADRIIRCVGDPLERLTEDALRAVRALRFSVTKSFTIEHYRLNDATGIISPYSNTVSSAMQNPAVLDAIVNNISDERIAVELSKMFRHDTVKSILLLNQYPALTAAMFSGRVHLDSSMKKVK